MASGDISFDDPSTWTGALDRCPCGTGTCSKMAVLHAKGQLKLN
jgi:proline racemase